MPDAGPGRRRSRLRLLPPGLFGRLRVQMMLLLVAGLLTVDVVAFLGVRAIEDDEVETTLGQASERIEALPADLRPVTVSLVGALAPSELYVGYVGPDDRVLAATGPVSTDDAPDVTALLADGTFDGIGPRESLTRTAPGGTDYQIVRVAVPTAIEIRLQDGAARVPVTSVVVGYPLTGKQQALRQLVGIELICALVVLGLWFLLSGGFIRAGLRPLRRIGRTAEAIAAGRTDERIEVDADDRELRQVAQALNEAFDSRQQSEDRMRDFVADASHELRTPLASVRGWTDLYREGGLGDWDGVDVAMGNIWTEAGRMELLVEDMLMLARYDTAPGSAAVVPVDLEGLLAEVVPGVAGLHDDHVYVSLPADPSSAGVRVLGDPPALRRALSNLLVNAGRHTPAGSTVTVGPGVPGPGTVEVRIADDGPGLTSAEREAAFDRFWRGDRSRGRPGGTGLGLPITRSILRAAGGDLRLEESAAGGLCAVVVLRVAEPGRPG